ncbi:hypothetical protein C5167_036319 [Papaver somniferum]|uniref:Phytocyanin domain-containing protein n=1 Tax=Papaver somniferum TaxID=3469 RepID=A0A4Y7I5K1_PAPSO|nr:uclacyanin-3-like [Papaver somniferum]RZC43366.1 hypothetical protein C5167_036319 [Papaver somniferum]
MATPSIITTATLIVLLLLAPAVRAVDYPVSWTLGTSYEDWDSDKTLFPGDTITFSYGPAHSLSVVKKDTYDNCGSDAIKSFSDGSSTVPLVAGTMYFICPEGNHCANGMKLSVKVGNAGPPKNHTSPPVDAPSPVTPKLARSTGAATSNCNLNFMVIGGSLLLAHLFAFLG